MAKNINIVALNKHIAYLTEENLRLRADAANLRNEIKLLDNTNAKLRLDLAACRSELASKIGPTIFASENRPEDRSGLGAKFDFVEKHFKPFPTIVPYPDPVVIEAHGLRIKVEKL